MIRRQTSTSSSALLAWPRLHLRAALAIFAATACAAACVTKKDVERAQSSSYDTEFAIAYEAAAAATREQYPNVTEAPQKGLITTAWHQVYLAGDATDPTGAQAASRAPGGTHTPATELPGDAALKRYFIRFDVSVAGGRPWRIRVLGRAAQWDSGNAVPTELRGASRPRWLEARTESLQVAIYKRLQKHAVDSGPSSDEAVAADTGPRSDPKSFADLPADAALALAGLRDEVLRRDWRRLRARVSPQVVWSLGADPGIDAAFALWQADPSALDEMQKALDAGCAAAGAEVVCPKAATDPSFAGHRLHLAREGQTWLIRSFVSGL